MSRRHSGPQRSGPSPGSPNTGVDHVLTEATTSVVRPHRGTGAALASVPAASPSANSAAKLPFSSLQPDHVPQGGLRYWGALCLASILGCNTGDLFASYFGFLSGLPILIAAFAG